MLCSEQDPLKSVGGIKNFLTQYCDEFGHISIPNRIFVPTLNGMGIKCTEQPLKPFSVFLELLIHDDQVFLMKRGNDWGDDKDTENVFFGHILSFESDCNLRVVIDGTIEVENSSINPKTVLDAIVTTIHLKGL